MGSFNQEAISRKPATKTISVTSGKGGVGKTSLVVNLAIHLSYLGKRVLILDGDLGMGNVDLMFGMKSNLSLFDIVTGQRELKDVLLNVAPNIDVIPGGSGIYELQNLEVLQRQNLFDQVSGLNQNYDYMLIDTAPGIASNVLSLNSAAQEIFVVLTPDPASLADAYGLIKVLNQQQREKRFSILTNLVKDSNEGIKIFTRLSDLVNKFLFVNLTYKGHIPFDPSLRNATKAQHLVIQKNPRSPSSNAIRFVAEKMSRSNEITEHKGGIQFFWQQMVGVAS